MSWNEGTFGKCVSHNVLRDAQDPEYDKIVQGRSLKKGMKLQGSYNHYNYGVDYVEILSIVLDDDHGDAPDAVRFDSVKDACKHFGLKPSLGSLEKWEDAENKQARKEERKARSFHVEVRDLQANGEPKLDRNGEISEGAWYYLYSEKGQPVRWCRGSGAEPVGWMIKSPPLPSSEALCKAKSKYTSTEGIAKAYFRDLERGDTTGWKSRKVRAAVRFEAQRYVFVVAQDGKVTWKSTVALDAPEQPVGCIASMELALPDNFVPGDDACSGEGWPDMAKLAAGVAPKKGPKPVTAWDRISA